MRRGKRSVLLGSFSLLSEARSAASATSLTDKCERSPEASEDTLTAFKERDNAAPPDDRQTLGREDLAVQPQKVQTKSHRRQTQYSAKSRHSSCQISQLRRRQAACPFLAPIRSG